MTATVVASDLASLHRRASAFGPEVAARRGRDARPAVGTRARGGRRAHASVHRSQLPAGARHRPRRRAAVVSSRCRCSAATSSSRATWRPRDRTGARRRAPRRHTRDPRRRHQRRRSRGSASSVDVIASYAGDGGRPAHRPSSSRRARWCSPPTTTGPAAPGARARASRSSSTISEAYDLADAQANGVLTIALVPPEEASRRGPLHIEDRRRGRR